MLPMKLIYQQSREMIKMEFEWANLLILGKIILCLIPFWIAAWIGLGILIPEDNIEDNI